MKVVSKGQISEDSGNATVLFQTFAPVKIADLKYTEADPYNVQAAGLPTKDMFPA